MAESDPLTADFATKYPDSFARVLAEADANEISTILTDLPPAIAASIVARMPASRINQLLDPGEPRTEQWLAKASFDDAVTLLSRIPRERRLAMVNSLADRNRRQKLLRHQQYPTHSVGALVGDVLMSVKVDTDAAKVMRELRSLDEDDPGAVVIVDAEGRYFGLANLWRLLAMERAAGKIADYALKIAPVYPETPIVSAAQNEDWLKHNWLPVVDHKMRVLGSVSRARVFRAANTFERKEGDSADVIFSLLSESVYVLGGLLDRVLIRGNKS
jgi:Mg/Co/Ni transporter MgtE